jgi:hypothetical protein
VVKLPSNGWSFSVENGSLTSRSHAIKHGNDFGVLNTAAERLNVGHRIMRR